MRLTRSNDDPTLVRDLERLANGSSSNAEPVGRFVKVTTHVRRYAPFYAGGTLWLLAMILIQPVGRGVMEDPATADYASAATSPALADGVQDGSTSVVAPAVDGFGLSVFSPPPELEVDSSPPPAASTASVGDAPPSSEPDEAAVTSDPAPVAPTPLRIVASGYSSQGAGSPYDPFAPKNGGLPVAAAGDRHLRRSFVLLAGTDTTLRLRMTTDQQETTMNASTSTIKACAITTPGWTAARGQALDRGPAYSADACATGSYQGANIWTFDLSAFPPVESGNGFALVPPSGSSTPFQVTFEPQAVTG